VLECVHVARRTASAFYSTFAWNACHTYPESSPDDYRDEGVPTQHEENVRQQILEGLIAAKGGGLSPLRTAAYFGQTIAKFPQD